MEQLEWNYRSLIFTQAPELSKAESTLLTRGLEMYPKTKYARFRMSVKSPQNTMEVETHRLLRWDLHECTKSMARLPTVKANSIHTFLLER